MKTRPNREFDSTATLLCIGTVVMWTTGPIFIKFLAGYLDLWTQNMLRYSIACLFWLPFLIYSVKKNKLDPVVWRKAILPAVPNIVMQTLWAASFYYLNPAFINLLSKSSILWIAAFSFVLFAEERALVKSPRFWIGSALSLIGVVGVLLFKEDFAVAGTATGIILALSAAATWGVYIVCAKIAFKDIDSRNGFAVVCVYTAPSLGVLCFLFGKPSECLEMPLWPWACVFISAITSIALSHVLFYSAIKRIGATIPSLILLLTPFTILAISRIVFGESLNGFQWLFGLVLLAGAAMSIWSQQHLKSVK